MQVFAFPYKPWLWSSCDLQYLNLCNPSKYLNVSDNKTNTKLLWFRTAEKYVFDNEDSDDQKPEEEEQTSVTPGPVLFLIIHFVSLTRIYLGHLGQFCPQFSILIPN